MSWYEGIQEEAEVWRRGGNFRVFFRFHCGANKPKFLLWMNQPINSCDPVFLLRQSRKFLLKSRRARFCSFDFAHNNKFVLYVEGKSKFYNITLVLLGVFMHVWYSIPNDKQFHRIDGTAGRCWSVVEWKKEHSWEGSQWQSVLVSVTQTRESLQFQCRGSSWIHTSSHVMEISLQGNQLDFYLPANSGSIKSGAFTGFTLARDVMVASFEELPVASLRSIRRLLLTFDFDTS